MTDIIIRKIRLRIKRVLVLFIYNEVLKLIFGVHLKLVFTG